MSESFAGQVLIVGAGGFVGAAARFAASGLVHRVFSGTTFPVGTLAVNLLGCLVIGFLGGIMEAREALGPAQRLFLMIGLLGGFTTYSTFAYETLGLTQQSDFGKAAANVVLHVVVGFAAAWLGWVAARLA